MTILNRTIEFGQFVFLKTIMVFSWFLKKTLRFVLPSCALVFLIICSAVDLQFDKHNNSCHCGRSNHIKQVFFNK